MVRRGACRTERTNETISMATAALTCVALAPVVVGVVLLFCEPGMPEQIISAEVRSLRVEGEFGTEEPRRAAGVLAGGVGTLEVPIVSTPSAAPFDVLAKPTAVNFPGLNTEAPSTETTTTTPVAVRSLSRRQKVTVLFCFIAAMFMVIVMACVHRVNAARSEILTGKMSSVLNTDRYILRILRQFSVKTVQDHIFHGIMPSKQTISIDFENLCTTIKGCPGLPPFISKAEDKRILTGVSGRFESGRVAAIMGTSGAGKTTFLNVLCGKIGSMGNWTVTGTIKVNDMENDLASLKSITAFVPQDDVVHERMTVRENILFSAKLRNSTGTSNSRLQRITNDVLQVLQLEAQSNIQIGNRQTGGGLSGGQRKRVNVGLELASCPTLLFLDEPTSGLDATGSLVLVRQLQKMTQLGMTIVMVIHQPRYGLFTLIDDVLLLGKGGRTCFFGSTDSAKKYFENLGFTMPVNENPADWMMDVCSGQMEIENPKMAREELPESLYKEWENYKKQSRRPGFVRQQSLGNRNSSEIEESEVIKVHLKDAWKRVDMPVTTALDEEQFSRVLTYCTGIPPEKKVVSELMMRVETNLPLLNEHGPRRTHTKGHVTHLEFEKFLLAVYKGHFLGASESMNFEALEGIGDEDLDMTESEDEENDTSVGGTDSTEEESPALLGHHRDGDQDASGMLSQPRRRRKLTEKLRISKASARSVNGRRLPGFRRQLMIIFKRRSIVWWRMQNMRLMFLVVVEFAAIFLGVFDRFIFKNPPWNPTNYMNCQISLALLTSVYSLRTFGAPEEMPAFWREVSHGLSKSAYFVGSSLLDILDMFLMTFGFATAYYIVVVPDLIFKSYVVPFIFVCYVSCSWGYLISCWLPFELNSLGPFISALLSFVFGGILGLPNEMGIYLSSPLFETVVDFCAFTRWGVPMIFFKYIRHHPPDLGSLTEKDRFFYDMTVHDYRLGAHLPGDTDYWFTGIVALSLIGTFLRAVAFLGLCTTNKSKQV